MTKFTSDESTIKNQFFDYADYFKVNNKYVPQISLK